jgi:hypothetical protein
VEAGDMVVIGGQHRLREGAVVAARVDAPPAAAGDRAATPEQLQP